MMRCRNSAALVTAYVVSCHRALGKRMRRSAANVTGLKAELQSWFNDALEEQDPREVYQKYVG